MRGRSRKRGWLDDRSPCEMVIEDGFAVSFEDRLGRHDEDELESTKCSLRVYMNQSL